MVREMSATESAAATFMSASMLFMAGLFFLLGFSLFPVVGQVIAIPLAFMAAVPWLKEREENRISIRIGSESGARAMGEGVIPVAVLTTSRAGGDPTDFDVRMIDTRTVRFGPKRAAPADDMTDPDILAERLVDVDGDGDQDLVFYFSREASGITQSTKDACLFGETVRGEAFQTCAELHPAHP